MKIHMYVALSTMWQGEDMWVTGLQAQYSSQGGKEDLKVLLSG